jgi:hypothetical protein
LDFTGTSYFNGNLSQWWQACTEQLRASTMIPDTRDRESCLAFFTGFSMRTSYYEDAVNCFGGSFLLDVGRQIFGDDDLFGERGVPQEAARAKELIRRDASLELTSEVHQVPIALPALEQGRLRRAVRVSFGAPTRGPELSRRLVVPELLAGVPELFKGGRRCSEIAACIAREPDFPLASARIEVMKLAYRLVCMGLVRGVP